MEFKYVTQPDSVSSDKHKILISMHPTDRYLYLEPLIQGILSYHDCTICYSDAPLDTSVINLDEIGLLIIGVTEKYIIWSNSGFISEGLPAIKAGIPVLPIMLEDGIVNLFNTRCGKLHYIENFKNEFFDEAILSINKHISTMFNGYRTSEKDSLPKIFISYRKCDKKQLNRLITQIKSHSKSNEISIWYDQSLNPGDNYSNTIIEQIKSCDLFLMLVTPNLLEPNNYVTRVEYPLAVKEKKRIVPIVMQKTDLNQLADSFSDIPKCITASQTDAIFSKIKK